MTRMSRMISRSHQDGAALVIGLILLVILTLLAVTGMNTSNMELVMAGNEQYRQRAFQAADTGVEEALTILPNGSIKMSCVPEPVTDKDTIDAKGDHYTVTAQYKGDSEPRGTFTVDDYADINYQIVSTGKSARNAQTELTEGASLLQYRGGFSSGC
jgi:type IV pilus assembly protein PilX